MQHLPLELWVVLLVSAILDAPGCAQGAERAGGPSEMHATNPAPPLAYIGVLLVMSLALAIAAARACRQSYGNGYSQGNSYCNSPPTSHSCPNAANSVRNRKKKSQAGKNSEKQTTEQDPEPAVDETPEGILKRFYKEHVFVQGDQGDEDWRTQRSYFTVKGTVKKLIKWFYYERNCRYPSAAIPMGSYMQGIHLQGYTIASDFDFLLPLRHNSKFRLMSSKSIPRQSYYETWLPTYIDQPEEVEVEVFCLGSTFVIHPHVLSRNRARTFYNKFSPWENFTLEDTDEFGERINKYLFVPDLILDDLYIDVHHALTGVCRSKRMRNRSPGIPQSIKARITLHDPKERCPAVQLSFKLGEDEEVFVDLVPAIHKMVVVSEEWIRHDMARLSDWWDKEPGNYERFLEKKAQVRSVGADIIAKSRSWRVSFADVETALLENIDCDRGQRREALRLLKFINNEYLVPAYGKLLTSYHLKTVLLWALEIYPVENWRVLESSLQTLLRVLLYCLKKKKLPHYFLRASNLFNKRYRPSAFAIAVQGQCEQLALEVLTKELELMKINPVQYISLRFPKVPGRPKEPCLDEFLSDNKELLQELKNMEHYREYEFVEQGWETYTPGIECMSWLPNIRPSRLTGLQPSLCIRAVTHHTQKKSTFSQECSEAQAQRVQSPEPIKDCEYQQCEQVTATYQAMSGHN